MGRPPREQPAKPTRGTMAAVDARLERVKARISMASLACLRGALDAPQLVRQALEEVDRARALLRDVDVDA